MNRRPSPILAILVLSWGPLPAGAGAQGYPRLAPYDAVRWVPEVRVDGRWQVIRSVGGVPVEEIVAAAEQHRPNETFLWQRRFDHDLMRVLGKLGHKPGAAVQVVVRDRETGKEKLFDFPSVRWVPEVRIDGQWHALRSIDGLPVERIVASAKDKHADDGWQRRFEEDIVQVLGEMGHQAGETVQLVLGDPATGKETTRPKVPMTAENREAIRTFREQVGALNPKALRRVLDEFKTALDERWSYRLANGADFDGAIAALRAKIVGGISANDFGIELEKIIALGIDGHAGVSGYTMPPGGYLPCLVEPAGDRFVAFHPDRTGFLAEGFPYVTKIDGKDVADWCAAAAVLVPKGSPQYVRRHSLRHLRDLDYLRGRMGLPRQATVEVELADHEGNARKRVTLAVAKEYPHYGVWPPGGSRLLGNIGYLRLRDMFRETSVPEIKQWMPRFKDTARLIVDVRDNGGGDRDALLLLYSYLAAPDDPPRVFTAAAYRLHKAHKEDHLGARFMYRADAKQWTEAERRAVAEFAKTFKPEWELPRGQFSDWHYLALRRLDDKDVYHYRMPVVVLMNATCFSATDIFLAGLKGMKNVTLLGTPSGGGSAMARGLLLGATTLRVRLGTMASFQADGKLFDGNGVHPDVVVEPVPEYHIGRRDNVLEEAVKRAQTR
jgi:hypothetical protein